MKAFEIKQPKTIGDVYSQSLDSLYALGNYAYRGSVKFFKIIKFKSNNDKKEKIRGLKPIPC
jgi:hypothetical protein